MIMNTSIELNKKQIEETIAKNIADSIMKNPMTAKEIEKATARMLIREVVLNPSSVNRQALEESIRKILFDEKLLDELVDAIITRTATR